MNICTIIKCDQGKSELSSVVPCFLSFFILFVTTCQFATVARRFLFGRAGFSLGAKFLNDDVLGTRGSDFFFPLELLDLNLRLV